MWLVCGLCLFSLIVVCRAVPIHRDSSSSNTRALYFDQSREKHTNETVCAIDDVMYMEGETIPTANLCEKCVCRPPKFECEVIKCEIKPGCRAIHRPNQCCPEYQCECEADGRIYQNGERLDDSDSPCRACYCQSGEIVCTVIECYRRTDCQPHYIPGKCCPKYDHCPPVDPTPMTFYTTSSDPNNQKVDDYDTDITNTPITSDEIQDNTVSSSKRIDQFGEIMSDGPLPEPIASNEYQENVPFKTVTSETSNESVIVEKLYPDSTKYRPEVIQSSNEENDQVQDSTEVHSESTVKTNEKDTSDQTLIEVETENPKNENGQTENSSTEILTEATSKEEESSTEPKTSQETINKQENDQHASIQAENMESILNEESNTKENKVIIAVPSEEIQNDEVSKQTSLEQIPDTKILNDYDETGMQRDGGAAWQPSDESKEYVMDETPQRSPKPELLEEASTKTDSDIITSTTEHSEEDISTEATTVQSKSDESSESNESDNLEQSTNTILLKTIGNILVTTSSNENTDFTTEVSESSSMPTEVVSTTTDENLMVNDEMKTKDRLEDLSNDSEDTENEETANIPALAFKTSYSAESNDEDDEKDKGNNSNDGTTESYDITTTQKTIELNDEDEDTSESSEKIETTDEIETSHSKQEEDSEVRTKRRPTSEATTESYETTYPPKTPVLNGEPEDVSYETTQRREQEGTTESNESHETSEQVGEKSADEILQDDTKVKSGNDDNLELTTVHADSSESQEETTEISADSSGNLEGEKMISSVYSKIYDGDITQNTPDETSTNPTETTENSSHSDDCESYECTSEYSTTHVNSASDESLENSTLISGRRGEIIQEDNEMSTTNEPILLNDYHHTTLHDEDLSASEDLASSDSFEKSIEKKEFFTTENEVSAEVTSTTYTSEETTSKYEKHSSSEQSDDDKIVSATEIFGTEHPQNKTSSESENLSFVEESGIEKSEDNNTSSDFASHSSNSEWSSVDFYGSGDIVVSSDEYLYNNTSNETTSHQTSKQTDSKEEQSTETYGKDSVESEATTSGSLEDSKSGETMNHKYEDYNLVKDTLLRLENATDSTETNKTDSESQSESQELSQQFPVSKEVSSFSQLSEVDGSRRDSDYQESSLLSKEVSSFSQLKEMDGSKEDEDMKVKIEQVYPVKSADSVSESKEYQGDSGSIEHS